jgi:hypothetical protein
VTGNLTTIEPKGKKKKTENKRKESTSSISQDQRKFTLLMGASK